MSGAVRTGEVNFFAAVNPVTDFLYVNSLKVDPADFSVVPAPFLSGVESVNPTPSNNRMYGRQGANNVAVIDGATEQVIGGLSVPSPRASAVNPTRNRVYVQSFAAPQSIYVFGGTSDAMFGTIPLPAGFSWVDRVDLSLAVNSTNGKLYTIVQDSLGDFFLLVMNDNLAPSALSLSTTP